MNLLKHFFPDFWDFTFWMLQEIFSDALGVLLIQVDERETLSFGESVKIFSEGRPIVVARPSTEDSERNDRAIRNECEALASILNSKGLIYFHQDTSRLAGKAGGDDGVIKHEAFPGTLSNWRKYQISL